MKWSKEKVQQLHDLAFTGKSNQEIARQLGVGINEVYAKRSKLGLTIDKVKAAQVAVASPGPEITPLEPSTEEEYNEARLALRRELGRKHDVLDLLAPALGRADSSIVALELTDHGRAVKIHYSNGAERRAYVEDDSLLAMIADVARKCLF